MTGDDARRLTGALVRLGWRLDAAEAVGHAVFHHPDLVRRALDGGLPESVVVQVLREEETGATNGDP